MSNTERSILIALLVLIFVGIGFAQQTVKPQSKGQTQSLSAREVAEKFLPSIVLIICDDGKGRVSQGSGFFVDVPKRILRLPLALAAELTKPAKIKSDRTGTKNETANLVLTAQPGFVLTNFHVVEGMVRGKAKVAIGDGDLSEWWIKSVIAVDRANDLALLELEVTKIIDLDKPLERMVYDPPKTPEGLKLSNSKAPSTGEEIFVLSNPRGLNGTISKGIISGSLRQINGISLLQFDAPISGGSSGGAVLNSHGEIEGMATGSIRGGQNLNFAVPSSTIRSFIADYQTTSEDRQLAQATVENGWRYVLSNMPRLDPATVGPSATKDSEIQKPRSTESPKNSSGPNLNGNSDDIINWLTNSLRNVQATRDKTSSRVDNLSISQCILNLSTSISDEGIKATQKYSTHLSNVKSVIPVGTGNFMGIQLALNKRIVEEIAWSNSENDYSLVSKVFVPSKPGDHLDASLAFELLRQRCANDSNGISTSEKPSLIETTKWLSNRVNGTAQITGSIIHKYQSLEFETCRMTFVELSRFEGSERKRIYTPNLQFLKQVNAGINTSGNWGIWLEFHENFEVMSETFGYFGKKEAERTDKITIFVDSYEKAQRTAAAFARMLDLCGVETKEPF